MSTTLTDMIKAIEFGTKLHISIVFLGENGNGFTHLPDESRTHKTDICDHAKSTVNGYNLCVRCRNTVLKRAIKSKKAIAGCCINGIYEYCRPVIKDGDVVCVIFIGHILNSSDPHHIRVYGNFSDRLISTLQQDFSLDDCQHTADILEEFIIYVLEKHGNRLTEKNDILIKNIEAYIKENLFYDLSMSDIAYFFGYNEKYLGRLFKSRSGLTIKEYINKLRVDEAKKLLLEKERKISEISSAIGFNNVTYFNKIFKAKTGISPLLFRKRSTKDD